MSSVAMPFKRKKKIRRFSSSAEASKRKTFPQNLASGSVDLIRCGSSARLSSVRPVCESTVSAKVNPHAKGLFGLEESVALSKHRVRDHGPSFRESGPFYFLTLYPAAHAGWAQYLAVSPLRLEVKLIPAVFQWALVQAKYSRG